jgi:hypothetical protein
MGETFLAIYDDDIWFMASVKIDSCGAVAGCVELEAVSEFGVWQVCQLLDGDEISTCRIGLTQIGFQA